MQDEGHEEEGQRRGGTGDSDWMGSVGFMNRYRNVTMKPVIFYN
jgi:hypothetical protein